MRPIFGRSAWFGAIPKLAIRTFSATTPRDLQKVVAAALANHALSAT